MLILNAGTEKEIRAVSTLNLAKLKVKVKSLAEEARIIRMEEKKFFGESCDRQELTSHRTWNVRNEARATQLAVAFLKGKSYKSIEPTCTDYNKLEKVIVPRIVTMVDKYCTWQFRRGLDRRTIEYWIGI